MTAVRLRGIDRNIVVRRVTKMGRDGRPKVAEDVRLHVSLERVVAQQEYSCTYWRCENPIAVGQEHVVSTRPPGPGVTTPFVKGRQLPETKRFHYGCVPPDAAPLQRFFHLADKDPK